MKARFAFLGIWVLLWVVAPIALARMLWALVTNNMSRALTIAIGFDDLANYAFNGTLGQTISARAAHSQNKLWGKLMCRLLNAIDPGHCERALNADDQNLK